MATLVLSAVGASLGASVGGTVFGLGSAVIGRAVGATLGRLIDQRLLGNGSSAVPTGKIDRFHLSGASEGAPVGLTFGRVRVGGQVIWASRFKEEVVTEGGGGKGGGSGSASQSYSYSVSLALALGEGVVTRIGRVWADGNEIALDELNLRFYPGDEMQLPDAKIEAVEGVGQAPAFRGTAYVVIEDLALARFGNRVPQFSFEVFRRAQPKAGSSDPALAIKGVALIPGTGEYALATTPVHFEYGPGQNRSANVNSARGKTDFAGSLDDLCEELEACGSISLVVSWFGDNLKCGSCEIAPKVEQTDFDGVGMPWVVSGQTRATASAVGQVDDRPVFGGTPCDQSVIEAIGEIRARGREVMFYPFVLMDILAENGLGDPWSEAIDQAVIPWRGRITLEKAPGQSGTSDKTAAAGAEVAAFFGSASASDFVQQEGGVSYNGPVEWSYRRFILHYAHLCAVAGGVDTFCIGSEMRGLTHIRTGADAFPAVEALRSLAAEVRSILGPETKLSYAADWSEYFGYHPDDGSGDVLFHLDPLWADANIDFIGIDNYMPLADWRHEEDHLDRDAGSIYALEYLRGNIEGGEGFDWYYPSAAAREFQLRSAITDGAYDEPWVFRTKDLRNWWGRAHHNRIGGIREANSTAWQAGLKPIVFTEIGCAAIDKGANQPNAFLDALSDESQLPRYSNGLRDDFMQAQYLRAMLSYWGDPGNNPISPLDDRQMLDMDLAHVWAWDARPWPEFPGNDALWSDAANYARGHWLNGRLGAQTIGDVIRETCERSGLEQVDVAGLYGNVTGYQARDIQSARASLQPLMLAYGVDSVEENGALRFQNRNAEAVGDIVSEDLVALGPEHAIEATRLPEAELAGKVRLSFIRADGSYETGAAEAVLPDEAAIGVSETELPLVLSGAEARAMAERWLAESRIAREAVQFALPPSRSSLGVGDVIELPSEIGGGVARIDRLEDVGARKIEAVRVEKSAYLPPNLEDDAAVPSDFVAPVPVYPLFLDLPLISGEEVPHAPHIAVTATPWPGSVAVYGSPQEDGFALNTLIEQRSVVGVSETPLEAADPDRFDNGAGVEVRLFGGSLSAAERERVLNGANLAAFGDGVDHWELIQFSAATLVGDDLYRLSGLLRGQGGSEAEMPEVWPVGSQFVLLNAARLQIDLAASARDLVRYYRVGPAKRPVEDGSYLQQARAFRGIGLRPFAPCHLRATRSALGDVSLRWTRRTRIDGDSWSSGDVPLGETFEAYFVRIWSGGFIRREVEVSTSTFDYFAAQQASDGASGVITFEVAQISERFGAGSFARIEIDG